METFYANLPEYAAVILFGIGFSNLLLDKNLIKKIIGLNIMDTSIYLFLAAKGYIRGTAAPIIDAADINNVDVSLFSNPVPSGLVLTGIVVSVSVTAVLLSVTIRLNEEFHTLDMDEILQILRNKNRENVE